MRHLTKLLLTAGLAVAFVSIVLAQRPMGGGGQQFSEPSLVLNTSVGEELKLTDAQKEKIAKIKEKYTEDTKDLKGKDGAEARMKATEARDMAAGDIIKDLKAEQGKRLIQIFVQLNLEPPMMMGTNPKGGGNRFGGFGASPMNVFKNETVKKQLKLDDKQVSMITTIADDTQKDAREIMKNVGKGDADAFKEAATKISTLNKEALDKIVGTFSDEQKKIWKELPGEKFTSYKPDPMQGGKKKKDN